MLNTQLVDQSGLKPGNKALVLMMANSSRDKYFYRNWVAFFLIGTINNLPYVVINSSAKVLASSFHEGNLVTLVMFSNVAFGFLAKGSNTLMTTVANCPFRIRFIVNGCFMIIGLVGVAFAPNFWVALAAIVFAGSSSSFGENLTLGYLHKFPKECIGAWSSGTGMAGLFGAVLYIALSCIAENTIVDHSSHFVFDPESVAYKTELKKMNNFVFLGTLPFVFVYWFSCFILVKEPPPSTTSLTSSDSTVNGEEKKLLINHKIQENVDSDVPPLPEESLWRRVLRCLRLSAWLIFNMIFVYFFEYACRGFAAKSRTQNEFTMSEVFCPELYASLQLCYQAGVFVSRSSVQMFQIKYVGVFTLLQLFNFIVWFLQVWFKFLPVYVLPAYMIYVGLLGGASYVNIFYLLRTDPKFPERDRELCINLVGMSITFGILFGTGIPIPLFKTIFKNK